MNVKINEKEALLDKIIFSGIDILGFDDMNYLVEQEIVQKGTSKAKYVTYTGQKFDRLLIENDGVINKLVAGSKILGGKRIDYCHLECTVKNEGFRNLKCYSIEDYVEYLQEIEEHLLNTYGIHADFSDITLKEVEINRTFKLQSDFSNYHRVITLLMHNLPSYLKNQMDYKKNEKDNIEYQTYYATSQTANKSKRYLLFKIYNKTKALEHIVLLTDSYMRVEFRLVGSEKVKKSLGTNKFAELTDQIINDYFNAQVQKLIINPLQKWQQSRDKYLIQLMKQQRQEDIRHWQTNVLRILQNEEIQQKHAILLDIEELIPLVNRLNLNAKRQSDVKKNFRKQAQKYETVFCTGDNRKLNEIIEKLTVKDAVKSTEYPVKCPTYDGMIKTA